MKIIHTKQAPEVVGPYSQAISSNGFIFCSGQIGVDPTSGELAQDLEKQTLQALDNLQAVIEESGASLTDIVKTTIYLTRMEEYTKVNEIYAAFFKGHKPARATIGVAALPRNALVEIDCIVYTKSIT